MPNLTCLVIVCDRKLSYLWHWLAIQSLWPASVVQAARWGHWSVVYVAADSAGTWRAGTGGGAGAAWSSRLTCWGTCPGGRRGVGGGTDRRGQRRYSSETPWCSHLHNRCCRNMLGEECSVRHRSYDGEFSVVFPVAVCLSLYGLLSGLKSHVGLENRGEHFVFLSGVANCCCWRSKKCTIFKIGFLIHFFFFTKPNNVNRIG